MTRHLVKRGQTRASILQRVLATGESSSSTPPTNNEEAEDQTQNREAVPKQPVDDYGEQNAENAGNKENRENEATSTSEPNDSGIPKKRLALEIPNLENVESAGSSLPCSSIDSPEIVDEQEETPKVDSEPIVETPKKRQPLGNLSLQNLENRSSQEETIQESPDKEEELPMSEIDDPVSTNEEVCVDSENTQNVESQEDNSENQELSQVCTNSENVESQPDNSENKSTEKVVKKDLSEVSTNSEITESQAEHSENKELSPEPSCSKTKRKKKKKNVYPRMRLWIPKPGPPKNKYFPEMNEPPESFSINPFRLPGSRLITTDPLPIGLNAPGPSRNNNFPENFDEPSTNSDNPDGPMAPIRQSEFSLDGARGSSSEDFEEIPADQKVPTVRGPSPALCNNNEMYKINTEALDRALRRMERAVIRGHRFITNSIEEFRLRNPMPRFAQGQGPRASPPVARVRPSVPRVRLSQPLVEPPVARVRPSEPRVGPSMVRIRPSVPRVEPPVARVRPSEPRVGPSMVRVRPCVPRVGPPVPRVGVPVARVRPLVQLDQPSTSTAPQPGPVRASTRTKAAKVTKMTKGTKPKKITMPTRRTTRISAIEGNMKRRLCKFRERKQFDYLAQCVQTYVENKRKRLQNNQKDNDEGHDESNNESNSDSDD